MIPQNIVVQSFRRHTRPGDVAVIEGNRGLYDGIDLEGHTSTAEIAKLLDAPVVLCINCTKTTRTMAAVVQGCIQFDPEVRIAGVILNRIAGARHEKILQRSIEHYCGVPVLGAVPKLTGENFPERHMGLVPTPEHEWAQASIDAVADVARRYLDLSGLAAAAANVQGNVPSAPGATSLREVESRPTRTMANTATPPCIGIVRDAAFQFYYPENIQALEEAGARVVFTSPLAEEVPPPVDGLYIGGGFPETHVGRLAENQSYRRAIKAMADAGMPIYAECGGLMYLGQSLTIGGAVHPMAGVLPVAYGFSEKPQGHGYTVLRVALENPFFPVGTELKGHEFHYSSVLSWSGDDEDLVFRMQRGRGIHSRRDGLRYRNVLATYSHIHALGTPQWAPAMVRAAAAYRQQQRK